MKKRRTVIDVGRKEIKNKIKDEDINRDKDFL